MRCDSAAGQLRMPGMPDRIPIGPSVDRYTLTPGQEVLYVGKVSGGPRFGSRGVIKQALVRRALVDMGRRGEWRIPYYLLTVPLRPA